MASENEMYQLIGRAVVNGEFRKKLAADPQAAAKELGVTLTPKQLEGIQTVEGKGLAEVMEERLPKTLFGNTAIQIG